MSLFDPRPFAPARGLLAPDLVSLTAPPSSILRARGDRDRERERGTTMDELVSDLSRVSSWLEPHPDRDAHR